MEEASPTESTPPEPSERGWVWHSTYETVKQGKISILAIVETLAAMSLFLWIAMTSGTTHLTISACVAPLLLLRTKVSTRFGLRLAHVIASSEPLEIALAVSIAAFAVLWITGVVCFVQWGTYVPLYAVLGAAIVLLIPSVALKAYATIATSLKHPGNAVRHIPTNWSQACLHMDVLVPIELLPGIRDPDRPRPLQSLLNPIFFNPPFTLLLPIRSIENAQSWIREIPARSRPGAFSLELLWYGLALFMLIPLQAAPLIVALSYRWSLKGSAFIYVPLLWIIHTTRSGTILASLKNYRTWLVHKIALLFGLLSIGIVLFRYLLEAPWNSTCEWLTSNAPLITEYVQPSAIPKWQMASAVNGLIGIVLYLVADVITRVENPTAKVDCNPWSTVFRSVWCVRAVLSVYTILCLLYISASLIDKLPWPQLGDKWFPW